MRSIDNELRELKIGLLQLQRSALIDTQAIMQILLDSGICTVDDIVSARERIENTSPEVKRLDDEIVLAGGEVIKTPQTEKQKNIQEQVALLKDLIHQFAEESNKST